VFGSYKLVYLISKEEEASVFMLLVFCILKGGNFTHAVKAEKDLLAVKVSRYVISQIKYVQAEHSIGYSS